jgi:hypothetical protein
MAGTAGTEQLPGRFDIVVGVRGSLVIAALLILCDGLLDGGFAMSVVVCPLWLLIAMVRLRVRWPSTTADVARLLIPIGTGACVLANHYFQKSIAIRNAARVIEACEDYRAANGTYPEQLEDLVPGFLGSIPRAKYCLNRPNFIYSGPPSNTLSWSDAPPFGRRVYRFETREWRSVD